MGSESVVSPVLAAGSLAVVFSVLIAIYVAEAPAGRPLRRLLYSQTQTVQLCVAAVAMGASLYYSEVVGYIPCEFCWFQRIAMYPLAVLLFVTVVSRSRMPVRYVVTLAGIGLVFSIYHYQLQLFPEQHKICSGVVACTDKNVEEIGGIVTIPFMAGSGFLAILLLQLAEWRVGYQFDRRYEDEFADSARA